MARFTPSQALALRLLGRALWRGDRWGMVATKRVGLMDRVVCVNERTATALVRRGLAEIDPRESGGFVALTDEGQYWAARLLALEALEG